MLTVITGPMFSGKTSKLLSLVSANHIAGRGCIVFKPSNDDRFYSDRITTHTGASLPAYILHKSLPDELMFDKKWVDLLGQNSEDVLFFDECQFFKRERFEWLIRQLLGRDVICAGLANDFQGFPFGAMPYILSVADEIIALKAVCAKCKKIGGATRTFRKTKDKAQTVVGGADMYEPRCFDCWSEVLNEV